MMPTFLSPNILFSENPNSAAFHRTIENGREASTGDNFVNITARLAGGDPVREWPTKSFCRLWAHPVILAAHISASAAQFHFQMSEAPFRKHASQSFAYKTPAACQHRRRKGHCPLTFSPRASRAKPPRGAELVTWNAQRQSQVAYD